MRIRRFGAQRAGQNPLRLILHTGFADATTCSVAPKSLADYRFSRNHELPALRRPPDQPPSCEDETCYAAEYSAAVHRRPASDLRRSRRHHVPALTPIERVGALNSGARHRGRHSEIRSPARNVIELTSIVDQHGRKCLTRRRFQKVHRRWPCRISETAYSHTVSIITALTVTNLWL